MTRKAILIGAGQIGRGFIGQVLHDAGYELVFVDVSAELVALINRFKEYRVIVVGAEETEHSIDRVKACQPSAENAAAEMIDAELVTTAVGPSVLGNTAAFIAAGIIARCDRKIRNPLTVIACENMEFGSTKLYQSVKALLNDRQLNYCRDYVSFPDAEVSRMVMPLQHENPLTVKVEQYIEWLVDGAPLQSDLSHIPGLELTGNPTAYIKRKMYTLTGHAMLGYLGYEKGYQYIYQAAYDARIFKAVYQALTECGAAWSKEYEIAETEFNEYITVMLRRFSDTRFPDPCIRICREPLRKLAPDERFIGPALTALKHHIMPRGIVTGIRSVFNFDYQGDNQAQELQTMLQENGLGNVLEQVCGLNQNDPLYRMIAGI